MDVQLIRGLLDVCVLAAIKNEDSYGYQIIKNMKNGSLFKLPLEKCTEIQKILLFIYLDSVL